MENKTECIEESKTKSNGSMHPMIETEGVQVRLGADGQGAESFRDTIKRYLDSKREFAGIREQLELVCRILKKSKIQEIKSDELWVDYKKYFRKETKPTCAGKLELYLEINENLEILKALSFYKIQNYVNIDLMNVAKENNDVNNFLINSTPNKMEVFELWGDCHEYFDCSFYLYGLREAASRTLKNFCIWSMNIGGDEFCSIIKAAKFASTVGFKRCKILTDDVCDFGKMKGNKITELNLNGSGIYCNWETNTQRLINIVYGIVSCRSLMSKLTQINLEYYVIDTKVQSMIHNKIYEALKDKSRRIPKINYK